MTYMLPDDFDFEDWQPTGEMGVLNWKERWGGGEYHALSLWQLAWGFLRHSSDYQTDWAFEFGSRVGSNGILLPPRHDKARRYGLVKALDPSLNSFDLTENPFVVDRTEPGNIYYGPREVSRPLASHEALLAIDLSKPLGPQLRHLKTILPSAPLPKKRLRRKEYATYLCLCDARAGGASARTIASVLHPKLAEHQFAVQLKNELRASRRLGNGGYLDLILHRSS